MNAEEIMTDAVVTVRSNDSVACALALLAKLDVRHLPVVDDGELVGMVSDRDLRSLGLSRVVDDETLERAEAISRMAVCDIMSGDVVSIEPATPVREVIDLMVDSRLGALPVVEPRTLSLVGIVSYVDVLRAAAKVMD
jgi:acetoin utilization protein AcuB